MMALALAPGCFCQAVNDGTGFSAFVGFSDHEVLATYGKRPDRLVGVVVIHQKVIIVHRCH